MCKNNRQITPLQLIQCCGDLTCDAQHESFKATCPGIKPGDVKRALSVLVTLVRAINLE